VVAELRMLFVMAGYLTGGPLNEAGSISEPVLVGSGIRWLGKVVEVLH
jgi:hypothetical protein